MTSVFFTPASRLTFLPPALVNLVRQQLEDDGLKPGEAETERRLNAARLAAADGGPDPVFFFAIDQELVAEGPDDPAELVNRSDLLRICIRQCLLRSGMRRHISVDQRTARCRPCQAPRRWEEHPRLY
jgi:hypothetical protein